MFSTAFTYMNRLDPNAQAFITAAGITSTLEQNAINNLVIGMKSFGLWNLMSAVYPFAGSTATSQKFNLINPQDTDAAFRLVFTGGWTHASTGATPNGSTAYADTKFVANSNFSNTTNAHFSIYSRSNVAGGFQVEFGVSQSNDQRMLLITKWSTNDLFADLFTVDQRITVSMASTNTTGLFLVTRINSTESFVYRNGSQLGSRNTSGSPSLPTINAYLSALNNSGTAANFSTKELAFASIGSSLTATQASNFYTIVQAYQTALGRNV